jgi:hypothetical protein
VETDLSSALAGFAAPDVNPPYGEKGGFRRVTLTLPPELYKRLVRESARRKIAGEPNQLLSSMLREAVARYVERMSAAPGGPGAAA